MKRALAARVKEEMGDPTAVPSSGPAAPPSSLSVGYNGSGTAAANAHPPSKMPIKRELPQCPSSSATASKKRPRSPPPNSAASGNEAAYRSSKAPQEPASKRGPGRPRKTPAKKYDSSDDDDEEGADTTSFYLKNQNAALGSELYAYRRRIYLLEREREHRRKECRMAGYKICELGGVWRGLECALGKELERDELLGQVRRSLCVVLLEKFCVMRACGWVDCRLVRL